MKGTREFQQTTGDLVSATGCQINYTHFLPQNAEADIMVMLAHGFLRSGKRMESMARHLASWGINVVTIDFCNSRLWAGNHDKNAADMFAISQRLQAAKTIYAGFSAGGLAALMASGLDPDTQAFLGLDMVDHREMGKLIAPRLDLPLFGLLADPSSCNASNNALDVYALARHAFLVKIVDATHCHFELPMDSKCTIVCGRGAKRFSPQEIQFTILGLTTAFLLWQTDIDPSAENWWSVDGQNFQSMTAAGFVIPVE